MVQQLVRQVSQTIFPLTALPNLADIFNTKAFVTEKIAVAITVAV